MSVDLRPLWRATIEDDEWGPSRPALPGDADADVAVVGGGYTGLWTALSLLTIDPHLRVIVVDAHEVGFGASGRNGGWCSALLPMGLGAVRASHGTDAAVRLQRAMFATVDEVGRVAATEGIDCHFAKGGYVHLARSPVQAERLRHELRDWREFGFGDDDQRWLTASEAGARVGASHVEGGVYTPHCAAIHPARLVRGLARAVERRGGVIHEHTEASEIRQGLVVTTSGRVRAEVVVRATEAFTPSLRGHRRTLAPIYSLMVATEPLPATVFDEIGLAERETFNDARRMIVYGQRTADDRIAFGGRGAPYHFASAVRPRFDHDETIHRRLAASLVEMFPALAGAAITHRWGGAVAAPRDWWCSVGLDRATGLAWAGGYVGDGVATTNLAGRTLAALITGVDPDGLASLPWVGHHSRRWEPEPLRWLGISSIVRLPEAVDRYEARTGRAERWRSAILDRLTGG
jgi:glycine/D-amino acid oxidase-like deaminating enzyme